MGCWGFKITVAMTQASALEIPAHGYNSACHDEKHHQHLTLPLQ
jgi:hypothetical protein